MNVRTCPHCNEPMVKPIGQMFFCKNDCDLKVSAETLVTESQIDPPSIKVGSRVRVVKKIDDDDRYKVGDEFFVISDPEPGDKGNFVRCNVKQIDKWNVSDPYDAGIYIEELEIIQSAPVGRRAGEFRRGDKVRVVSKHCADIRYKNGDILYVLIPQLNINMVRCSKDKDCDSASTWIMPYPDEIELMDG